MGDLIGRHKNDCRYYEEEAAKNTSRREEYLKVTQKYRERITQNEEQLANLRKELEEATQQQVETQCQVDLEQL